ncbi:hypothetical protein OEZ85_002562 [Tetradesmus obliquus]|uniref:Guanylate-binding protein N-terminal domain-containing protein n=1 Tax=Tetradesmus obliquus TaxID=3088 RepID=A0ABY8U0J8_TETOB|nr:hypothetical protein OEZ85_002562 [Tetradesmus obliquus]
MMPSIKLKLSMRPITTPVNLLLCGASSCGKSSFIRAFVDMLQISDASAATATEEPGNKDDEAPEESCRVPPFMTLTVSGTGAAADPHAVLLAGSDEFAAAVGPISVPEAGREVQYRLQVYGLLDHAWDSYTAFCSAYEGAGGCSIAALVSAASAAATQAVMPSCTALAKGAKQLQLQLQLQQERQMATELRDELLAVRRELEAEKSKACALQAQLKSAEADADVAWGGTEYYAAAFEREQKLLDELWKAVTTYFTRVGRFGIISSHLGSTSKELQARLPKLAGASKAAAPRRVTDLLV